MKRGCQKSDKIIIPVPTIGLAQRQLAEGSMPAYVLDPHLRGDVVIDSFRVRDGNDYFI